MGRRKGQYQHTYRYKLINWHDEVFEEWDSHNFKEWRDEVRGRGGSYIVEIWEKYDRGKIPSNKPLPLKRFIYVDSPDYVEHIGIRPALKVEIKSEEDALDYFPLEYRSKYNQRDITKLMAEGLNEHDARFVIQCHIKKWRAEGKICNWTGDRRDIDKQSYMNNV